MATGLFLCTLEHVLEMTTIQLRALLEAQHEVVHDAIAQGPKNCSHLLPDGFIEVGDGPGLPWVHADRNLHAVYVQGHHRPSRAAPQEMHGAEWWSYWAHCSIWQPVFFCALYEYKKKQADPHHVLALYLEYNKLDVCDFSFNLKDNLRNDAHRKLGPVFWVTWYKFKLWTQYYCVNAMHMSQTYNSSGSQMWLVFFYDVRNIKKRE